MASTSADSPLRVCPFESSGRDRPGPSSGHSHHEGRSVSSRTAAEIQSASSISPDRPITP
jgi:hypothetical protein